MKMVFKSADILIPKNGTDMTKWSVVACDQYTSEPQYWNKTESIVGDAVSTLRLTLPEIYLEDADVEQRIDSINKTMNEYIENSVFDEYKDSFVYIERTQEDGRVRKGLIGVIDLEEYDYSKGSKSPVRATEATVAERIPPRVKIRKGASLELPHIMILIDDPDMSVIEPLTSMKCDFKKVYDFEMMQNSGSIVGYVCNDSAKESIYNALDALQNKEKFNAKYGLENEEVLTYAMGDGNHSLATAKACYEQLKAENPGVDLSDNCARYALVEIVNLHSDALQFEAIHRIVTNVDTDDIMAKMTESLGLCEGTDGQSFEVVINGQHKSYSVTKPTSNLTVGSLQSFLDAYLKESNASIDYIHGIEVVDELSKNANSIGFILPDMDKSELFPTVIKDGALPRKTFSMGHAWDKRFYIECRKIK
ncbi:MAG: DUF1015 domain-containing protein [Oscillospiraceae bacterium]|nr:DUF1015 domain-containing protein [Oscillospiraceae bacterium]